MHHLRGVVYYVRSGGRIGEGSRLCADFFVPSIELYLFKRLQIAVICVYLRNNTEYETDQSGTRSSDRQAERPIFWLYRGHISLSDG